MGAKSAIDPLEIQSLLARYVFAIDEKDYDALDDVFAADARIVYVLDGGTTIDGSYSEVKDWIIRTIEAFPVTQHLIGLPHISIDGNTARAKSMLFNPMLLRRGSREDLFFVGGTYQDDLVRGPTGWRIKQRRETGQ